MNNKQQLLNIVSYCGLYCKACPSYNRGTCLGCRSEEQQPRKSKWSCKIRKCCIRKEIDHCGECDDFPCDIINKKLIKSHENDEKFEYRHNIPKNIRKIRTDGIKNWLNEQDELWRCKTCGGQGVFYELKCWDCAKPVNRKNLKQ